RSSFDNRCSCKASSFPDRLQLRTTRRHSDNAHQFSSLFLPWRKLSLQYLRFAAPDNDVGARASPVARLQMVLAKLHIARMSLGWDDLRHFLAFARAGSMQA